MTGTGGSADSIGGLIGWLNLGGPVQTSFSTGNSSGNSMVGGLIGQVTQSSVSDAYATGSASGATDIGGLVGFLDDSALGSLTRGYAIGSVTATGIPVGGLVARGTPVTSSYWNATTTGQSASPGGGTSATTAAMTTAGTFVGWSITSGISTGSTWGICAALNSGYPFLQWFAESSRWSCNGGSLPVSGPPLQFLSYGRPSAEAPCASGWQPSWAWWMNDRTGGFTCDRIRYYDLATGTWKG